jgi:predicted metalloprotease with PDZ domain
VPVTGNEAFSHNACRKRNKTNKNMSASAVSSTSAYSVTLNKKTKDTRVGILFKKYHEGVKVADISKGGIALHSSLRVGDKILSIDGKEVTDMTAKQAASLLRSTLGQVEIVAESTNSSINKVGHSAESTPLLISTSTMNSDSTSTTTTTSAFEKKILDLERFLPRPLPRTSPFATNLCRPSISFPKGFGNYSPIY